MSAKLAVVTVMEPFQVTLNPDDLAVTIQEITFDDHSKIVKIPAETWPIIVREVARAKRVLAQRTSQGGES